MSTEMTERVDASLVGFGVGLDAGTGVDVGGEVEVGLGEVGDRHPANRVATTTSSESPLRTSLLLSVTGPVSGLGDLAMILISTPLAR